MPELPEVESIVSGLKSQIMGRVISRVDVLDEDVLENAAPVKLQAVLGGQTFTQIQRRGKFIIFVLSNGFRLTCHLRMTGAFLFSAQPRAVKKHDRLIISFADGAKLYYQDLRRFGRFVLYPPDIQIDALDKLGPEPLGPEFDANYLQNKIGRHKVAIKQLLTDQSIVAGIGNIYAAEILFAAELSPFCAGSELNRADLERLVDATRQILAKSIKCLGTTFSDYRTPDGGKGNFQECLMVYGRAGKPCLRCGAPVKRVVQAQRSTFFCPQCQKLRCYSTGLLPLGE